MPSQPSATAETDTQLRGSSLLLAGRLLATGVAFFTQALLVRYLSTDDFGAFAYGLGVVVSARILVSLGHNRIITRFVAIYRERHDESRLLGVLVMELLLIGSLGTALFVGVFAAQDVLVGTVIDDRRTVAVLAILVLLAPLEAFDELAESILAAYGRAVAIFWRQHVIAPALRLGVVLVLIALDAGVTFLAVGYVAATLAGLLFYTLLLRRLLHAEQVIGAGVRPRPPVREVFGFSFPLLTAEFVYISVNTVSVVVLGYFHGSAAVGQLRAIGPLSELNLIVRRQFLRLFLANAARLYERDDLAALRATYVRTAAWLAVLTFPVLAVTVPLAEPVTVALFGERYAGSAPYLALLAAGFYVNAAAGFNAELLQIAARVRWLVVANVITIALHVSLMFVLGYRLGALGIALATAVALVVQNTVNQMGVRSVLGAAIPRPLPRVYLAVAVAISALAAVQLLARPALFVGLVLVVPATAAVMRVTRDVLVLGDVLPRLRAVPVVRSLIATSDDGQHSTRNAVSGGRRRRRPAHRKQTARRRR
jgi:O-antigen/teichoic acid export membrane protein